MFFHLGKYQTEPVQIHEITPHGEVRHLGFDSADFDYGGNKLSPQSWGDVGLAGLRVHHALQPAPTTRTNSSSSSAPAISARSAAGQRYGLSARGLAIDTVGGARRGVPALHEFWLERPAPGATRWPSMRCWNRRA